MIKKIGKALLRQYRVALAPRKGPGPVPVFLVGRARSGTTVFRTMLNSHPDFAAFPEIFNAVAEDNYIDFLQRRVAKNPALCRPEHAIAVYEHYIETCRRRHWDKAAVVFDVKIECAHVVYKPWQAARDVHAPYECIRRNNWHIILLTRNNHLARLVSNTRAMQTGEYHRHSGSTETPPVSLRLELDHLLDRFHAFDEAYERLRTYFEGYPRFLEFDYDKLFDGSGFRRSILEQVAERLRVANRFQPAPRHEKVIARPLKELLENYHELEQLLRGTPYERFL